MNRQIDSVMFAVTADSVAIKTLSDDVLVLRIFLSSLMTRYRFAHTYTYIPIYMYRSVTYKAYLPALGLSNKAAELMNASEQEEMVSKLVGWSRLGDLC
jgi:hypothetical protein